MDLIWVDFDASRAVDSWLASGKTEIRDWIQPSATEETKNISRMIVETMYELKYSEMKTYVKKAV